MARAVALLVMFFGSMAIIVAAVAAMAGGLRVGAAAGAAACTPDPDEWFSCVGEASFGGLVGAIVGAVVGVFFGMRVWRWVERRVRVGDQPGRD